MKLTKHKLKEIIREVIREEKQLNEDIGTLVKSLYSLFKLIKM